MSSQDENNLQQPCPDSPKKELDQLSGKLSDFVCRVNNGSEFDRVISSLEQMHAKITDTRLDQWKQVMGK